VIKRTTTSFYSEINKITDIVLPLQKSTGSNVLSAAEECNLKAPPLRMITTENKPCRLGSFYRSCGSVKRIRLPQVSAIATLAQITTIPIHRNLYAPE